MEDKTGPEPEGISGDAAPVVTPEAQSSPARQRFDTCRWRELAENGTPAHCTHRDVAPMAGVNSFDPDAWCPDCCLYKVRRTPRKRPMPPPPDRFYY